jgi:hypothetical protein
LFSQRIQEKIPADPFEAELLMMAEMVASDKKDDGGTTDEDSNAPGMVKNSLLIFVSL